MALRAVRCTLAAVAASSVLLVGAAEASAGGRIVVLFAASDAVPEELIAELRSELDAVLVDADFEPNSPDALAAKPPDPWGAETPFCLSDVTCVERLQKTLSIRFSTA